MIRLHRLQSGTMTSTARRNSRRSGGGSGGGSQSIISESPPIVLGRRGGGGGEDPAFPLHLPVVDARTTLLRAFEASSSSPSSPSSLSMGEFAVQFGGVWLWLVWEERKEGRKEERRQTKRKCFDSKQTAWVLFFHPVSTSSSSSSLSSF